MWQISPIAAIALSCPVAIHGGLEYVRSDLNPRSLHKASVGSSRDGASLLLSTWVCAKTWSLSKCVSRLHLYSPISTSILEMPRMCCIEKHRFENFPKPNWLMGYNTGDHRNSHVEPRHEACHQVTLVEAEAQVPDCQRV